jgi:hypothetical protein
MNLSLLKKSPSPFELVQHPRCIPEHAHEQSSVDFTESWTENIHPKTITHIKVRTSGDASNELKDNSVPNEIANDRG